VERARYTTATPKKKEQPTRASRVASSRRAGQRLGAESTDIVLREEETEECGGRQKITTADGGVWGATENHDRGRRSMRAHAPAHDAREHPLCETHDKHHTRDLTQQQSQGMLEPCVSMLNSERRCCSTGLQPAPCEPNARSQRVEKDTSGAASGL
jgi:hypothetical protein